MSWHVDIVTLFPEIFPGPLSVSVLGRALKEGIWSINVIDLHDFAADKKIRVDDTPYGGGAGMVIRPDIIGNALDYLLEIRPKNTPIVYMSARGKKMVQRVVEQFSLLENIIILCGRFEGIDQRVIELYHIKEISIGDYILAGGDLAACVLVESCVRLLPGVLGNRESIKNESFVCDSLEHSHYTRPYSWKGLTIPSVLVSGNHESIREWRRKNSDEVTTVNRPDLLCKE